MLKRIIIALLCFLVIVVTGIFLIDKFFFRTDDDVQPEISKFPESHFNFKTSKPFYFKTNQKLYYSKNGELLFNSPAILGNDFEQAFVSPNGKYILIFNHKKLTLINYTGKHLFDISDCTGFIPIEAERNTGRFISCDVQWGKNSDFFLILQDRVWDKNYSKKNKSTIYEYLIANQSFKPLINLDEEVEDCFALSTDGKDIYYEFATKKGDLDFKKINIATCKVEKEYHSDDSLRNELTADSLYFNYKQDQFDGNDYNLKKIVLTATIDRPVVGLYLYNYNNDSTSSILKGTLGLNAFKDTGYDFYQSGYFLPGNKFFIANVSSKSFTGQIVINTQTLQLMKLKQAVEFYFNINSNDCKDFVFRNDITPNIKFSTSIALKIEGENRK